VTRSKHGREHHWRRSRASGSHSHRTDRRANGKSNSNDNSNGNGNGKDDDNGHRSASRRAPRRTERRFSRTKRSEPSAEQPAEQPEEQPVEPSDEQPAYEQPADEPTEPRRERRRPEPHHVVADVEPLDVDGVRTVAIGSVAWIVAFVAMLPFIGTLKDNDRLSWLWICIAGFGLGLIGVEYCRRRRNLLASEPGRRRAAASQFGPAGD
jgi:hypothetical protein